MFLQDDAVFFEGPTDPETIPLPSGDSRIEFVELCHLPLSFHIILETNLTLPCVDPFRRIRAGTELTWDYNYEVGSVEGKELLCCCGSTECRGRLL